ncbi:MAG: SNF2-related protein [Bacteroidales bacterium]|nr:SNF2-related protein [Bacteroidales bacterium]
MSFEAENTHLVLVVRQNRYLGLLLTPYLVSRENKNFLTAQQAFSTKERETLETSWKKTLHEHALNIEPQEIANRFHRKKIQASSYFEHLEKRSMNMVIMPFVWKQTHRILQIGLQYNLPIYKGASWPNLYPDQELSFQQETTKLLLHFERTPEKTLYKLKLRLGTKKISLNPTDLLLSNQPCLVVNGNQLLHFDPEINGKLLLPFFRKKVIEIPRRTEKQYFEQFIRKMANHIEIEAIGFELIDLNPEPVAQLFIEENWKGNQGLSLKFIYDNKHIYPHHKQQRFTSLITDESGFVFRRINRDKQREQQYIDTLKSFGFTQDESFFELDHTFEDQLEQLIYFLQDNNELLDEAGFRVEQPEEANYVISKPYIDFSSTAKKDWFDLHIIVKAGTIEFPFLALRNHLIQGKKLYRLSNGQLFLIPQNWFEKYRGIAIHSSTDKDQQLRISKKHGMLLPYKITTDPAQIETTPDFKAVVYPDLKDAQLRSYQKTGFQWLNWLISQGYGGILADDMGLGKTIQIISLLAHRYPKRNETKILKSTTKVGTQLDLFAEPDVQPVDINDFDVHKTEKPSLIVMPASLIHNWVNEFEKFAPNLRYTNYTGNDRSLSEIDNGNCQLILTTYGTLRNDIEILNKYHFYLAILDESQAIKNRESKTTKAIYSIQKDHGIAITGTPIENSLYDLWSQFEFANPGLLGNIIQFEQHYLNPIIKHQNHTAAAELQKLITPFILRRTKAAVEPDLPELTQIVNYCEMLPEQYDFYEKEKSRLRNYMLEAKENPELNKNLSVLALRALMKLRQIANHPVLADKESHIGSGKFEAVIEKLETLLSEGQKVLIFSSFTTHLQQFADYFSGQQIPYALLKGSTRNREQVIDKFKQDDKLLPFLISLKSGGFGLNLTEAGYVFILDPWWNPAAEMQALSRAHRIGQDKKVFVYRFISKDSIEEKIMGLQFYKSQLSDSILDTEAMAKKPALNELMALLS